jgi:hypothetical protein
MFPLHQVSVRGRQRLAEDFEELEWLFVRAIRYAWVQDVAALRAFYGLDEHLARFVVEALKDIGHLVEGEDGRLRLTPLGRQSLADERRYQEFEGRQVLYFDAYTCHPLPHRYYRLRFFAPGELEDRDRALYSFEPWRPEALDELLHRPDRDQYNVADEVQSLEELRVDVAYLPMHIVEAALDDDGRVLRVFTNVRGRRDAFFESLLAEHPRIVDPLRDDARSPQEVMGWGLQRFDLSDQDYRLQRTPGGEWRVCVPEWWLSSARPDGMQRLADLGEYLLAADYCVRVWSEDRGLRRRAACVKLLDRLEYVPREPDRQEVRQWVDDAFAVLDIPVASVQSLLRTAREQGMGRAHEKLEILL